MADGEFSIYGNVLRCGDPVILRHPYRGLFGVALFVTGLLLYLLLRATP